MEQEIWKECGESKRSFYEVSNMGNVRSIWKVSKITNNIKGSPDKDGYLSVFISKKSIRIHRLVISTFTEVSDKEVDHINRIRTDNRLENLRYVSRYENSLNNCKYRTDILEQDPKKRQRIIHNQSLAIKINCPCGSILSKVNISRHEKSEKHKKYLNSLL
jgi:hypothetical protein